MLDPKIIKDNPQRIRDMLKARAVEFNLDELIESDQKRRNLILKTDEMRKKKNQVALEISQKKKSGGDISPSLAEMKNISGELAKLESLQEEVEKKYSNLALTIPNLIHESVPIGKDETFNIEIKKWGTIPKFDFKINVSIWYGFTNCV